MVMRLCRAAYVQLIEEDIAWLRKQPHSLERGHIEAVLRESIKHEYDHPRGEGAADHKENQ